MMRETKTAKDVIEQEEERKVQPELELLHTVVMEEGFLPNTICIMYVHQRKIEWREVEEPCRGFGCMDDSLVTVLRQRTEVVGPELELATFDEKALKAHVEQWGTKVHEKPSYLSTSDRPLMNKYETWLTYKKIEFQQLQGVRLLPDERSIEIAKIIKEREAKKK